MASEDNATEGQIKRLYAVLHSVGLDPKQWKKDQNIASYSKLTRAQCSAYIDEVEALEAEQKATGSYHPSGRLPKKPDELDAAVSEGYREAEEAQKIREEQGRGATPAAPAQPAAPTRPAPVIPPNLDEWIAYYTEILARTTVKLGEEDRIEGREKGYGTKFVFYSVKHALENGKNGGDHEEQA